jgi:hypothetical protein
VITIEPQRLNALRKHVTIRFGLAALTIPIILFAMAGTLRYWQGWLYWMILLTPMLVAASYFLKADPEIIVSFPNTPQSLASSLLS